MSQVTRAELTNGIRRELGLKPARATSPASGYLSLIELHRLLEFLTRRGRRNNKDGNRAKGH